MKVNAAERTVASTTAGDRTPPGACKVAPTIRARKRKIQWTVDMEDQVMDTYLAAQRFSKENGFRGFTDQWIRLFNDSHPELEGVTRAMLQKRKKLAEARRRLDDTTLDTAVAEPSPVGAEASEERSDSEGDVSFRLWLKRTKKVWQQHRALDWQASFARRAVVPIRRALKAKNVLQLRRIFDELWTHETDKNLWALNTLVYALTRVSRDRKVGERKPLGCLKVRDDWNRKLRLLQSYKASRGRVSTKVEEKLRREFKGKISEGRMERLLETYRSKIRTAKYKVTAMRKRRRGANANLKYDMLAELETDLKTRPEKVPMTLDIEHYWGTLATEVRECELEEGLVKEWSRKVRSKIPKERREVEISRAVWRKLTQKLKAYKAAGPDCIKGYWWKALREASEALRVQMQRLVLQEDDVPEWLPLGQTCLVYKKGETTNPANYRPIACLNVCYKLLTAFIAECVNETVKSYQILPIEQRASRSETWGTIECLMLDQAIARDAIKHKRNLAVAWIDFEKAFDSIPHKLINAVLKALRVPKQIRYLMRELMTRWMTQFRVTAADGQVSRSRYIQLKNGVFQGDSMSPLLFCLAIAPLSDAINARLETYRTSSGLEISHMFYMDDLKLYTESAEHLKGFLQEFHELAARIGLKLGISKCAQAFFAKGKLLNRVPPSDLILPGLDENEPYKYLGVKQTLQVQNRIMRKEIGEKAVDRCRSIWSAKLNARNTVRAHNERVIGLIRYYINAGVYTVSEAKQLDKALRATIVECKGHLRSSSSLRLHLKRRLLGRGVIAVEEAYVTGIITVYHHLATCKDPVTKAIWQLLDSLGGTKIRHQENVLEEAEGLARRYGIGLEKTRRGVQVAEAGRDQVLLSRSPAHRRQLHCILERALESKRMAQISGTALVKRFYERVENVWSEPNVRVFKTARWSTAVEATLIGIQEETMHTRAHEHFVQKTRADPWCRMGREQSETVWHISSGCKLHAYGLYKRRHDEVAKVVYDYIARYLMKVAPPRKPTPTIKTADQELLYDFLHQTTEQMTARKPDLTYIDHNKKLVVIVEFTVPADAAMRERYEEKKAKYDPLRLDLAKQHPTYRIRLVVVVVGVTGTILPRLLKELALIEGFESPTIHAMARSIARTAGIGTHRVVMHHFCGNSLD